MEELLVIQRNYTGPGDTHIREEGNDLKTQLEHLGVSPEDIDIVIHTHLHYDHLGRTSYSPTRPL